MIFGPFWRWYPPIKFPLGIEDNRTKHPLICIEEVCKDFFQRAMFKASWFNHEVPPQTE